MSLILKYGAAALVFLASLAASHYSAYHWGFNAARLEQSEDTNKALAAAAQHIIDEQSKLQNIEDIIKDSTDDSAIKSPILMRTLIRVSKCANKPHCD